MQLYRGEGETLLMRRGRGKEKGKLPCLHLCCVRLLSSKQCCKKIGSRGKGGGNNRGGEDRRRSNFRGGEKKKKGRRGQNLLSHFAEALLREKEKKGKANLHSSPTGGKRTHAILINFRTTQARIKGKKTKKKGEKKTPSYYLLVKGEKKEKKRKGRPMLYQ